MLTLPFSGTELGAQDSTVELLGVQTDSTLLGVQTDSTLLGVQTDSTLLGVQTDATLLGAQTDSTLLGVHTDSAAGVLGVQTDSTAVEEATTLEGVHQVLVYSARTTVAAVAIKAIVEIDILDMWCEAKLSSVWLFKERWASKYQDVPAR
jgi:hypothetical protein